MSAPIRPATERRGPHRVEHVMGMPILVDVRDERLDDAALDLVFDWLRFVDATFSTYRADSDVCRLNRGEASLEELHPDVRLVLERCEELREETGGYFDARASLAAGGAPGVDPSGYVKGWSVDRAGRMLEALGARSYCVNAGGDVLVHGEPAPGARWRVGVQHPLVRDGLAAVVEAGDLAVATSGAYERGAHVLDPHTGRPAAGVLSVTVVGPDLGTADAYATAAFAMGRAGAAWTARLRGYEAMTVVDERTVLTTPRFPAVDDEPLRAA